MQCYPTSRLWLILLGLSALLPAVAQQAAPAPVAAVRGAEGARLDFTEFFCRGLKALEVEGSWTQQHHVPSGAQSDLHGPGLHVTALRYLSDRSATGPELAFASLSGEPNDTDVWSASWQYRRYFTVQPRRAAFWQGGVGAAYLTDIIPEQSSNWNFYLSAAAGMQWAAADHGAWQAEYRLVHVSNAGTSRHNQGINASELRLGRAFYF